MFFYQLFRSFSIDHFSLCTSILIQGILQLFDSLLRDVVILVFLHNAFLVSYMHVSFNFFKRDRLILCHCKTVKFYETLFQKSEEQNNYTIQKIKKTVSFELTFGLFGNDYRFATLPKSYPTVIGIIMFEIDKTILTCSNKFVVFFKVPNRAMTTPLILKYDFRVFVFSLGQVRLGYIEYRVK